MKSFFFLYFLVLSFNLLAITSVPINVHRPSISQSSAKSLENLDFLFKTEWKRSIDFAALSKQSLSFGPKAVPVLINVMKRKSYPSTNRWIAMFSLTKLMGKKSAPVLSKFSSHPDWMMRLASLKCLLFLKEKKYVSNFSKLLFDPSQVVRQQALTNINILNLKEAAPDVNRMLQVKNVTNNEEALTDLAVLTIAKLDHKESVKTLVEMMKKNEFKNNSPSIDYSLEKLTGKKSPNGDWRTKVSFWNSTVKI